jgi:hypothetical protein
MLQSMRSKIVMRDVTIALENTQITNDSDMTIKILYQYNSIIPKGVDALRIIMNIVMKGFTRLNKLVMRMSLKIWSC